MVCHLTPPIYHWIISQICLPSQKKSWDVRCLSKLLSLIKSNETYFFLTRLYIAERLWRWQVFYKVKVISYHSEKKKKIFIIKKMFGFANYINISHFIIYKITSKFLISFPLMLKDPGSKPGGREKKITQLQKNSKELKKAKFFYCDYWCSCTI